jgi:hypothetical protein
MVGVWFFHLQRNCVLDRLFRGNEKKSGGAGFSDECGATGEALEGMDFDASSLVVGLFGGVIFPDGFSGVGFEFDDVCPAELKEDVAGGEDVEVVKGADTVFPAGALVFVDDGDALFGGVGGDEGAGGGRFVGRGG